MPFNVTVKQDNLPKGAPVYIEGLGTFKNGTTTVVSDEQAELFQHTQAAIVDGERPGDYTKELGPKITDLNIYGVTVEKKLATAEKSDKAEEPKKTDEKKEG